MKIMGSKSSSISAFFNMILLLVFSIASLALAFSAAGAFQNIEDDKSKISELIVALSYINMKVKQNDSSNAIRTEPCPSENGQALVITETFDSAAYETWIYWCDGKLRESCVLKGDTAVEEASTVIAEIDGFHLSMDESINKQSKIRVHIWCNKEGKARDLTLTLSLRGYQLGKT